ncbi:MAG TPA: hypothetical protein VM051_02015 [Usitatibacter sp.]|nr:hypothetical protein [Usitatibacter sp.]
MLTTWFARLERANSVAQVLTVARDYFATWTPEQLALLSQNCRPKGLRGVEDMESLRARLVEEYRTSAVSGIELDLLQQMTSFVVRATIRLAELGPPASGGPNGSPDDPARSLAPRKR